MRVRNLQKWRGEVLKRDNYTCQKCGKKEGRLEAHHIKPVSEHPELIFEVSNGLTLCPRCHKGNPIRFLYGPTGREKRKRKWRTTKVALEGPVHQELCCLRLEYRVRTLSDALERLLEERRAWKGEEISVPKRVEEARAVIIPLSERTFNRLQKLKIEMRAQSLDGVINALAYLWEEASDLVWKLRRSPTPPKAQEVSNPAQGS